MLTRDDRNGTPTGPDGHPELEDLAALIDGRVSADTAARLRSHLASCAECREVFFETIDFVRAEEAGWRKILLPFRRRSARVAWKPERSPSRLWRWAIALPAAAAVAAGGGFAIYANFIAPPEIAWIDAAATVSGKPGIHPWDTRKRGGEGQEDELIDKQSFRLGVAQVNLMVGLDAENRDGADAAAARINQLNADINPPDAVKEFYLRLRTEMVQRKRLRALVPGAAMRAQHGYDEVANPLYLNFGRWTEAGNLAVEATEEQFLARRSTRRFPSYLLREARGELDPKVVGAVQRIAHILGHRSGKNDLAFAALAVNYATILTYYEPGGGPVSFGSPRPRQHLRPPREPFASPFGRRELLANLAILPPRRVRPARHDHELRLSALPSSIFPRGPARSSTPAAGRRSAGSRR